MDGVALVLAGGGGKGAYHIGVWKALREFGVDKSITAVAGTSVGSLNTALIMQGNYELAEHVWTYISHDKLLTISPSKIVSTITQLGLGSIIPLSQILSIATMISQHGVFSREGMEELIHNNLNAENISNSDVIGFATCCKLPFLTPSYFKLNQCSYDRLLSILLASSGLPIIYGAEEIDGNKYVDGGLRDNLPIKPLYDEGYRQFIVVHLNRVDIIDHSAFVDANFIEILPRNHQGNFINGTLDFSPEGAVRRIQEGYNDTVTILKPIYEMGVVQQKIDTSLHVMKEGELEFTSKRLGLKEKRSKAKMELKDMLTHREVNGDA